MDTYEELLQHLIHFHKICRKFYETTQAAQPPPTPKAEQPKVIDLDGPEVIDLDADEEEAVNVTAPEAMAMVVDSEVVEIDPQVNSFEHLKEFEFLTKMNFAFCIKKICMLVNVSYVMEFLV